MIKEWNEKEWNMGDVHLVEIMNKKDLGVKLENRIRIVSFWQRTLNLATSLPGPKPLHL